MGVGQVKDVGAGQVCTHFLSLRRALICTVLVNSKVHHFHSIGVHSNSSILIYVRV